MWEKFLIVLVGLPRSGKSTLARKMAKELGAAIVNPDSIRLAMHSQRFDKRAEDFVWATAKVMTRALFIAGHSNVIIDATNTTRKRRDFWQPDDVATWSNTVFKIVGTSRAVCLERADKVLVPVVERMAAAWEPLDYDVEDLLEETDAARFGGAFFTNMAIVSQDFKP